MGLYPVEGNWYANEIKIIEGKGAFLLSNK